MKKQRWFVPGMPENKPDGGFKKMNNGSRKYRRLAIFL